MTTAYHTAELPRSRFRRGVLLWLGISLVFWTWYTVTQEYVAILPYAYLWLGLIGGMLWTHRAQIAARLRDWPAPEWQKFLLLGYGAVLLEEIFAALVNHVEEGFFLPLYLGRIGQFWAFNVLAFTGFVLGWYLLLKRYHYTPRERFFLAGCWGLFSEGVLDVVFTNPLAAVLVAPLVIFTYGLILTPAMLSLTTPGTRPSRRRTRWTLAFAVPLACSLLPLIILVTLREQIPWLFPPRTMID